jgi:hypothetical protein
MGDSDSDVEEVHQRLERDNLVFKHSMSVPLATEDSDAWDDSALITAYHTAIGSYAVCVISAHHSPAPGGAAHACFRRFLGFRRFCGVAVASTFRRRTAASGAAVMRF